MGAVRALVLACALLVGAVRDAVGQEALVPFDRQVVLMNKIVQFDRAYVEMQGEDVVFAIVYQRGYRASLTTQEALVEVLTSQSTFGRKRVHVVSIELDENGSLDDALLAAAARIVYVAPLRAVDIDDVVRATRGLGILSFTGVPAYVSDGVSIGITMRGDHAEILINLPASRLEGARLSSELLKLSHVIGGDHDGV